MTNSVIPHASQKSIAVIGVGRIGSSFAFTLAKAGHDVTGVARPSSVRLQQLQRDQGILSTTGERGAITVTDHLDEQVAYDLVIVTVLAHQVGAIMPGLKRCRAKCIHFMFNTFEPEQLMEAIGADRFSCGMPFVMAQLDDNGRLNLTVNASRKSLHSDQRWVDMFQSAGIASALETNMLAWLRCHTPLCIAMESISVKAKRRGGGASWQDATTVARGMKGVFVVIQGLGYEIYPKSKSRLNALPTVLVSSLLWSVSRIASFRDLLATGADECGSLIDVVAVAGQKTSVPITLAIASVQAMKP